MVSYGDHSDAWRQQQLGNDHGGFKGTDQLLHPADRYTLILRDRDTDGNGTLDERLYQLKQHLDPVAVIDASGAVQERYQFTAFGRPAFLAPDYSTRASSSLDWDVLFHVEQTDPETGWMNYGFRYYAPDTGRWLSRDPIGERGGINLYAMAYNDPVNLVDRYGLNVYAVDGTNYNVERHPQQISNVHDFHVRSDRGGENSKYYGGVASRSAKIGPGDVTGYLGPGTEKIIKQVKEDVCTDYCDDHSIKINMVGWSRGAVVVQEVAKRLEEDGCCCWDGRLFKPVSVNFLGLYDSVERIPFRDYEDDRPANIDHFHHALRSDPGGIFKQQLTGDPNERPYPRDDGTPSNHGDIGTGGNHLEGRRDGKNGETSRVHARMVRWAKNSDVKIDTSGL